MARNWYIARVYTGYENRVQKYLQNMMQDKYFSQIVFEVKVPVEDVVEMRNGKKVKRKKKILPGYILLSMDLEGGDFTVVMNQMRRIEGFSGFLNGMEGGDPLPISKEEEKRIFFMTGEITKGVVYDKGEQAFLEDESVRIVDGPFETFVGKVVHVDVDKMRLKVMVGIFGRNTPVEVDFSQVEKV